MRVDDTPDNLDICMGNCGNCPSLPHPPAPFLYCSRGRTETPVNKDGCDCSGCEVFKRYGLEGAYFCAEGAPEAEE